MARHFTFRKKKNNKYKKITIKTTGPLLCIGDESDDEDNKYVVDVMYFGDPKTHEVSIKDVLQEHLVSVNDYLLYSYEKWSPFGAWYQAQSLKIAPRFKLDTIIHHQKLGYIHINWLPPPAQLYGYPGYERDVALAGGYLINDTQIIATSRSGPLSLKYKDRTTWYLEAKDPLTIVCASSEPLTVLRSILKHKEHTTSINVLQTALRGAQSKLRPKKYGQRYYVAETVSSVRIVLTFLKEMLKKYHIPVQQNRGKLIWRMSSGIAKCILQTDLFSKNYADFVIFASNMKCTFNMHSGRVIIRGFILKRNIHTNDIDGLDCLYKVGLLEDSHILLPDLSCCLLSMILEFCEIKDLIQIKNVCVDLSIACLELLEPDTWIDATVYAHR
eukprot:78649_1